MSYSEPLAKISLLRVLGLLVGFVLLVWWALGMTANGDPLWFWSRFDATPASITLYYRGQTVEFRPGERGFSDLTAAFNTAFSARRSWSTLGVSPESADEYRRQEVALAFHYPQPVPIHSPYRFGPQRGLFLPLTGRHAEVHPVWGLDGDTVVPGAMQLGSVEDLKRVLADLGYGM